MTTNPHPHAAILKAYADDMMIEIEGYFGTRWAPANISVVTANLTDSQFRIKPKMRSITVNGVEHKFPEPMKDAPESEHFFIGGYHEVIESRWGDSVWQKAALKAGFCQATREGAEAQRRALIAVNGGSDAN